MRILKCFVTVNVIKQGSNLTVVNKRGAEHSKAEYRCMGRLNYSKNTKPRLFGKNVIFLYTVKRYK